MSENGSPIPEILDHMGGTVEKDELRYQLDKRGIAFDSKEVQRLIEEGLIVQEDGGYQAAIPTRESRSKSNRHRDWTEEQILDRVRLWAMIVGKPPTSAAWSPTRMGDIVQRQIGKLRARVNAHAEMQRLYKAGDWPSTTVVHQHFGSLNAALVIAGFKPRSQGGQPRIRPTVPPRYGPDAMEKCIALVTEARESKDRGLLRDALYELAVAALAEADRIKA